MEREKLIILPKLHDCGGKCNGEWFIFYSFRDPVSAKMRRFKEYEGFKDCKSLDEKYAVGKKLCTKFKRKLLGGWNPFDNGSEIFSDSKKSEYDEIVKRNSKYRLDKQCNEIIEILISAVAPATQKTYRRYLQNFLLWTEQKEINHRSPIFITDKHCNDFLVYLSEAKKLGVKQRNEHLSFLKKVFNELRYRKFIIENPWDFCKKMRHVPKIARIYKEHQRKIVTEKISQKHPILFLYITMIYYTFIRPNEVRFLQLKNIDIDRGQITVTGETAKNSKTQTVAMPYQLWELLIKMKLHEYPEDYYLFGIGGTGPGAEQIGKNYFNKKWAKIRETLGFTKEYKLYNFKHTGAYMLAKSGVNIKTLQLQLRHSSLDMVNTYLQSLGVNELDNLIYEFPSM